MFKIYTSGPIDFATDDQVLGWRQQAERDVCLALEDELRVKFLHPERRDPQEYKDIIRDDMRMMRAATLIMAWTPPIEVVPRFVGTCVEIYHCDRVLRKPVFSWGCDVKELSPWIRCFIKTHNAELDGAVGDVVKYLRRAARKSGKK